MAVSAALKGMFFEYVSAEIGYTVKDLGSGRITLGFAKCFPAHTQIKNAFRY